MYTHFHSSTTKVVLTLENVNRVSQFDIPQLIDVKNTIKYYITIGWWNVVRTIFINSTASDF